VRDFTHPSRPALRSNQPPLKMGTGSFPGMKRQGRGSHHPHPRSVAVKERGKLYIPLLLFWAFMACSKVNFTLLSAFAKLRKANKSLVMSIRPSVRMEQLGYHWKKFYKILYFSIFRKCVKRFKFH